MTMRGIRDAFKGLYHLDMKTLIESSQINVVDNSFDVKIWHCKVGDLNYKGLKFMSHNEMATRILANLLVIEEMCYNCQLGKHTW
jgi:hypothetical protein